MSLDLYSFLLRTVLIGLAAMGLLLVLRRRSASVQHAVSASALIATLVLAPASLIAKRELKPICTTPVRVVEPVRSVAGATPVREFSMAPNRPGAREFAAEPEPAPRRSERFVPTGVLSFSPIKIWALIAGILLLRFFVGFVLLGRRLAMSKWVYMRPNLLTVVDPQARGPMAVWWGRPMIVLPPSWVTWSEERLDTVLMHESVHLDRGDCWIQFAAALACTLAWPNPLIWWLKARTRVLSEQSVDDFVLRVGVPPVRYAQDLLDVAQCSRNQFNGLGLQMAAKPEVFKRIEMILNDQKQRGAVSLAALIAMGVGFSGLAVVASGWSLVPARTIAKVESLLPDHMRKALSEVASLDASFQGSASTPSSPESFRSTELTGESWDSPAQAIEPAIPSPGSAAPDVQSAVTKVAPATTRTSSGAPSGQVYRVKIQAFSLDPNTDMSQFGIDASAPTAAGGHFLSQGQLADLRSKLEAAGKRCVFQHSAEGTAETPGSERALGGSSSSQGNPPRKDRILVQANGDKSANVIAIIEADPAANLSQAMITIPVDNEHPGAYVIARKHLRGWCDLWLIDAYPRQASLTLASFLTQLSTDSPDSPAARNLRIWFDVMRITVADKALAAKLHALPQQEEPYRVTDFSSHIPYGLDYLSGSRSTFGIWLPEAGLGKQVVQEYVNRDRERFGLCYSQDGTLRVEINGELPKGVFFPSRMVVGIRPPPPDSSLPYFVDEQKLKPGDERLIVGQADAKTGTIPAWIVRLHFYDDGFWLRD